MVNFTGDPLGKDMVFSQTNRNADVLAELEPNIQALPALLDPADIQKGFACFRSNMEISYNGTHCNHIKYSYISSIGPYFKNLMVPWGSTIVGHPSKDMKKPG